MSIKAIPQTGRTIRVADSSYKSQLSNDMYMQRGFESMCATQLVRTPDKNYFQALAEIPKGYRMSTLEEIAFLIQREKELKAEGKSPREALNDGLFDNFIRGNPYLWMHTHAAFRAPKGKKDFTHYVEKDKEGRTYHRGDYVIGDRVAAEGIWIPEGNGRIVTEWNEALRIPAVTSDGNELNHTTHHYFDPSEQEVEVVLDGGRHVDEHGRCLLFCADYGRSLSYSDHALRLVQGSLGEVTLPGVEYFVKDRESFDKGVAQVIRDIKDLPIQEVLRKYDKQV